MTRGHDLIATRALLGVPALLLATSCVPHADGPRRVPPHIEATAQMLRRLDLNVPRDIPATLWTGDGVDAGLPPAPAGAAPAFFAGTRSADDATRALECLTAAVYYEARSQSDDGQRAVAQVVLNRVRDRAFPASVCGVVYQGASRATGCQFSFTCDGSMAYRRDERSWAHARAIAAEALGGAVYAPVGSATFYHANYVSPWWAASMDRVATVGAHIFYRWRRGLENALAFRQSYSGAEPSLTGRTSAPAMTVADAGAAPAGAPALYADQERIGGVTVHRNAMVRVSTGTPPAPASALAAVAITPVAPGVDSAPVIRRLVRADTASGVRVHRGEAASLD